MDAPFHKTIDNNFASLHRLMRDATQFLENEGVDHRAVYQINLALEEMVTNIIKYGYDAPGHYQIVVTLHVDADQVVAVIVDDGHPFNPVLHEKKEMPDKLENCKTGGLGIHVIKKLLSHMNYRREEERNILEIKTTRQLRTSSR